MPEDIEKKVSKLAFVEYVEKAALVYFQEDLMNVFYEIKNPLIVLYVTRGINFAEIVIFISAIEKNYRIELPGFKQLKNSIEITLIERGN
jgi:hypothetical protein